MSSQPSLASTEDTLCYIADLGSRAEVCESSSLFQGLSRRWGKNRASRFPWTEVHSYHQLNARRHKAMAGNYLRHPDLQPNQIKPILCRVIVVVVRLVR